MNELRANNGNLEVEEPFERHVQPCEEILKKENIQSSSSSSNEWEIEDSFTSHEESSFNGKHATTTRNLKSSNDHSMSSSCFSSSSPSQFMLSSSSEDFLLGTTSIPTTYYRPPDTCKQPQTSRSIIQTPSYVDFFCKPPEDIKLSDLPACNSLSMRSADMLHVPSDWLDNQHLHLPVDNQVLSHPEGRGLSSPEFTDSSVDMERYSEPGDNDSNANEEVQYCSFTTSDDKEDDEEDDDEEDDDEEEKHNILRTAAAGNLLLLGRNKKKKSSRRSTQYLCKLCGVLKKHHVCAFEITTTVQPAATQVSEHTFQELARSDVHPFVTEKTVVVSRKKAKEQDAVVNNNMKKPRHASSSCDALAHSPS